MATPSELIAKFGGAEMVKTQPPALIETPTECKLILDENIFRNEKGFDYDLADATIKELASMNLKADYVGHEVAGYHNFRLANKNPTKYFLDNVRHCELLFQNSHMNNAIIQSGDSAKYKGSWNNSSFQGRERTKLSNSQLEQKFKFCMNRIMEDEKRNPYGGIRTNLAVPPLGADDRSIREWAENNGWTIISYDRGRELEGKSNIDRVALNNEESPKTPTEIAKHIKKRLEQVSCVCSCPQI
jgi:hypothetical protein